MRLLENGEEFFPRVFELIAAANSEVLIETFILANDKIGQELQTLLIAAAQRGVRVQMTADGYGSAELSSSFIEDMIRAGVRFRLYDPQPRVFNVRVNLFRRLHRKLVVVDNDTAMIGGINFSTQHLREFGALSKQDYAVEVRGPVVADIQGILAGTPASASRRRRFWRRRAPALMAALDRATGGTDALLVTRDNHAHRNDIERLYRLGIRSAQQRIVIANAYFLPGYRLLRDLRNAARRGVDVRLILQGNPDMPIVRAATVALHDYLLRGGVRIYEYCERPLHAKVAVIDDRWSTVGSSNLDPLSLFLNLEANLVVRDQAFNTTLSATLDQLMQKHCKELSAEHARNPTLVRQALSFLAFHLIRRAPTIAGWLPAHAAKTGVTDLSAGSERVARN
ncbi:MAG: clsB [Nevskia sp.]|nr:clsB [Nevskia sp.]